MHEDSICRLDCGGVVILNEDQADLTGQVVPRPTVAVLRRPVTLKQLHRTLQELMAAGQGQGQGAGAV